jgi:hypothetical protein
LLANTKADLKRRESVKINWIDHQRREVHGFQFNLETTIDQRSSS